MSTDLTRLDRDARGVEVQLGLFPNGSRHIAMNTTSGTACTTLDTGVGFVEITTTAAAHFIMGSNAMVAGDGFFIPANFPKIISVRNYGGGANAEQKITAMLAVGGTTGTFHLTQFK